MLNKSADYFETIARNLGLSIHIPRPGKKTKHASILTNGLVGAGFIASGVLFKKMPLTLIGIIGIAGAVLLALDE